MRAAGALIPLRVAAWGWSSGDGPHSWCPRQSEDSPGRTSAPPADPGSSGGRAGLCADQGPRRSRGEGGALIDVVSKASSHVSGKVVGV